MTKKVVEIKAHSEHRCDNHDRQSSHGKNRTETVAPELSGNEDQKAGKENQIPQVEADHKFETTDLDDHEHSLFRSETASHSKQNRNDISKNIIFDISEEEHT